MSVDPLAASRTHRVKVGVGAAIVLLVVALGVAVLVSAISSASASSVVVDAPGVGGAAAWDDADVAVVEPEPAAIFVHILGEVTQPGLVQLREGDRVIDAVAAAGGYTDRADRAALNLARFVSDGEQLVVFAEGEAPPVSAANGTVGAGAKVNINTADSATLELLPRVGPALAARIIQWRDANGRFRSIEDLMSVSGIGEKTFAGLRDLITV